VKTGAIDSRTVDKETSGAGHSQEHPEQDQRPGRLATQVTNLKADVSRALRAENLQKSFRGRRVVNNVSVIVRRGEIVGLLGPNGAGKTTTFHMIVGLERPDAGRVLLGEQDITWMPLWRRARHGIGYLPQEASIFRKLTVEQNIMAILETLKLERHERHERLEQLIEEFRLGEVRRNKGMSLSGGERRRTEIARSLTIEPEFMLLDEPFAGIDPLAIDDIQRIVLKLRDKGIGVLITDHNVREALEITDHAYIINEGQLFRTGTPQELAGDPEVRKVYLGERFRL
jgi:lipopolysaccharide export system ATP-binding protein